MITKTIINLPFSFTHTLYHSTLNETRLHGHSCYLSFVFENTKPQKFYKKEVLVQILTSFYIHKIDQSRLNDLLDDMPATSENLLIYLKNLPAPKTEPHLRLCELRLKETDKNTITIEF